MRIVCKIAAALLLVLPATLATSQAAPITQAALSAGDTMIGFDDLAGGSTLTNGTVVTNQYAAAGVLFQVPGSNHALANSSLQPMFPGSSAQNVLFVQQNMANPQGPLSIVFSVPVTEVGFLFASSANSYLSVLAYDSAGALLDSQNFVGSAADIGAAGFAGVRETQDIARLDVSYHPNRAAGDYFNFSIDNLTFGTAASRSRALAAIVIPELAAIEVPAQVAVSVPEPASLALLGTGLLGVFLRRRRR